LSLLGRQKREAADVIKSLRLEAKLSLNHLARLADLDRATVSKAEKGGAVSELTLHKMASALGQALGRNLTADEMVAK
jgi:transcriptional regulator with XRE-family HTH domain